MDSYQQHFIANLKHYRRVANLSQAGLAELCNVATGTIGNIECGVAKPSFDLILSIADVLKIHPAFLFASDECFAGGMVSTKDHELLQEIYERIKAHFE
ncbi:MAG: helix-turn-helix transcriptional regulator [Spirochaetaceae bacterium]|nr:helix-turn-helix transcriptional regulator [Spirochaetaceae bacterium]